MKHITITRRVRIPQYVRIETIYAVPIVGLALCAVVEALGRIL